MTDLFEFLKWRGDISFDEVGFNKIDALMFAQLSYLNLRGIAPENFDDTKTLSEISYEFVNSPDFETRKNMGMVINKRTPELMVEAAKSIRYQNVKISGFVDKIDEPSGEQFSAMIFNTGKEVVVAYRGTDDTIVGWKEDFNIAWMDEIPSQKDAIEYFNKAAKVYKHENLIITGHSKGGNLALNTAAKAEKKNQKRILQIYNFDGTGFPLEFFKSEQYLAIKDKVLTFYPGFCVVGMLFYHPENFQIIKSDGFAVMQHDPLTWQIFGGSFEKELEFTEESQIFHRSFNKWMNDLNQSEKERFVTALFDVVEASGAHTNTELSENLIPASKKMMEKLKTLDKETKSQVHGMFNIISDILQSKFPIFKLLTIQK